MRALPPYPGKKSPRRAIIRSAYTLFLLLFPTALLFLFLTCIRHLSDASLADGKITRPLRGNGAQYSGINIVTLWSEAVDKGYNAPIWMTFRQAKELGAHVRKGEHGTTVVYASTFTKTEFDEQKGEDIERDIPFRNGSDP